METSWIVVLSMGSTVTVLATSAEDARRKVQAMGVKPVKVRPA